MTIRSAWRCLSAAAACLASSAPAGSAPPQAAAPPAAHDHDHHDHGHHAHPKTLAEGVAELEKVAQAVKNHLAADGRKAADDAVHALGHLLEDAQGLVRTSTLAADAKAAATKSLDELFECFDSLDTALHAEPGEGAAPADVHGSLAPRIKDALEVLRGAAIPKAAGEDPAAAIILDAQKKEEDRR